MYEEKSSTAPGFYVGTNDSYWTWRVINWTGHCLHWFFSYTQIVLDNTLKIFHYY